MVGVWRCALLLLLCVVGCPRSLERVKPPVACTQDKDCGEGNYCTGPCGQNTAICAPIGTDAKGGRATYRTVECCQGTGEFYFTGKMDAEFRKNYVTDATAAEAKKMGFPPALVDDFLENRARQCLRC